MRRRRPKDRICIDTKGNTQKLSDCMINAKIPAAKRDQIPILASGSRVLWIAGVAWPKIVKSPNIQGWCLKLEQCSDHRIR